MFCVHAPELSLSCSTICPGLACVLLHEIKDIFTAPMVPAAPGMRNLGMSFSIHTDPPLISCRYVLPRPARHSRRSALLCILYVLCCQTSYSFPAHRHIALHSEVKGRPCRHSSLMMALDQDPETPTSKPPFGARAILTTGSPHSRAQHDSPVLPCPELSAQCTRHGAPSGHVAFQAVTPISPLPSG